MGSQSIVQPRTPPGTKSYTMGNIETPISPTAYLCAGTETEVPGLILMLMHFLLNNNNSIVLCWQRTVKLRYQCNSA